MRRLLVAAVLAFAAVRGAAAEATMDGPGQRFDDDLVSHLEGRWIETRLIRGQSVPGRVEASWVLEHQFLRMHLRNDPGQPRYEAEVFIGWSAADRRYVIHWMDTWGGRYSGRGEGVRDGDTVAFRFADPDGSGFLNTFRYDRARDAWSMTLENVDASGRRSVFATETLERVR